MLIRCAFIFLILAFIFPLRTSFARDQALIWSEREAEFVKRAGFVLMAQVAGKDKHAPPSCFSVTSPTPSKKRMTSAIL
jgi:hypothetical protein